MADEGIRAFGCEMTQDVALGLASSCITRRSLAEHADPGREAVVR